MGILTAQHLSTGYDNKVISETLNYEFQEGNITSIIGPNGCGKSTLLKTVSRLLEPKKGVVLLNSKSLNEYGTKEVAKEIAILSQSSENQIDLSVYDLVSFGRYPYQRGWKSLTEEDKHFIQWSLEITQLSEMAMQPVSTLSGGQRQRVWIAMALVQDTDILILDEPTTYLDPAHQLDVLNVLREINKEKNKTIIMTLHDINLASRFSHQIIGMEKGKIVEQGTPNTVINQENLRKLFGIEAEIVCHKKTKRPLVLSYEIVEED